MRQNLDSETLLKLDQQLLGKFSSLSFDRLSFFHFFLPIERFREPNTRLLMDWLRTHHPEVQCVVSKCSPETRAMEHYCDFDEKLLIENKWGIPEPGNGRRILASELDAVLVPLLIFDKTGHRVGYGKGFYDRFLKECRPDCKKIGISYFDPIEVISDVNQTDIPLDLCITPNQVWYTKASDQKSFN